MPRRDGRVTASLQAMAAGPHDGLGWFAALLASVPAGRPVGPARQGMLAERVLRLGRAGFLAPQLVARVLREMPAIGGGELISLLIALGEAGQPWRDVWAAIALCGEPGLARLDQVIRTERSIDGPVRALHEADTGRAVAALRVRIFGSGLPVGAGDAQPLRYFSHGDVSLLARALRRDPASTRLAQVLGWTEHIQARDTLLSASLLGHRDQAVRQATLHGLGAYCARRSDPAVDAALLNVACSDPAPEVRMVARTRLEVRALISPATQHRLEEGATIDELTDEPALPPIDAGMGAFTARIRDGGPGRRLALAYLEHEPALLAGPADANPIAAAVADLADRTLRGECGAETVFSLCRLLDDQFIIPAVAALHGGEPGRLHSLAIGLARAVPGREDVFAALAAAAGRSPHPLTAMTLRAYDLSPDRRADLLLTMLETLRAPSPAAVRVWADAFQELAYLQPGSVTTPGLRQRAGTATEHVLNLPPPP